MKKMLAFLLIASLVCLSGMAMAERRSNTAPVDSASNFRYDETDSGNIRLTEYTGSSLDVIIPSEVDGQPVTELGLALFKDSAIESVLIPDSVTKISGEVFSGCKNLATVTGGANVIIADYESFMGCTALTEIPAGFTSLRQMGFSAFRNCTAFTELNLPEAVTIIDENVFRGCTGLVELELSKNITQIYKGAFLGCTGLKNVVLPEKLNYIGVSAFSGCTSMTECYFNSTNCNIEGCAFENCSSLREIRLPNGCKKVDGGLFSGCTSLETVEIPASATWMDVSAFNDCTSLKKVQIVGENPAMLYTDGIFIKPETMQAIGFIPQMCMREYDVPLSQGGTERMLALVIPEGVVGIQQSLFHDPWGGIWRYKYEIKSVVMPSTLTTIGAHAFQECSSLKDIVFPDSVVSIGYGAFMGCSKLNSIKLPDNDFTIESMAFYGTNMSNIVYPANYNAHQVRVYADSFGRTEVRFRMPTGT